MDTPITLHEFKVALRKISVAFYEPFLVTGIVHYALSYLLGRGNTTALAERETQHRQSIDYFESRISEGKGDIKSMQACLLMMKTTLANLEENLKEGYEEYTRFCESRVT